MMRLRASRLARALRGTRTLRWSPTTINQLTIGDSSNLAFSYNIGAQIATANYFGGFVFGGTAPSLTMTATTAADQTIAATVNGNLTISQNSTSANLIIGEFRTSTGSTITIGGPGNTTIANAIAGGGGVTITGSASVTLGAESYIDGPLVISSGTLNVVGPSGLGPSSVGSLSGSAGTSINLAAGAVLNVNQSAISAYSGLISGQGALSLGMSNGALTLNNTNTYTGGATINTGTLVVALAATTASGSSIGQGPLTINSGTLTFTGVPTMPLALSGALTTGGGAMINVPSGTPGNFLLTAGSLAQANNGTIVFVGNAAAPAIQFTANPATSAVNSSTIPVNMLPPWAVVQFAATTTDGDFATAALTGNGYQLGIVPYSSRTLANSGPGDAVAIQPPASTTTTLSANATAYALKVGGGGLVQTLDLGGNALAIGDSNYSGLILNNSVIQNGTVQLNGAGYVYASGNSTVSAAVTGGNGLTLFGPAAGGGTLTLTNLNNAYGNTNINGGNLIVGSNSNLGPDMISPNGAIAAINFYGGQLTIVGTTAFSTMKQVTINSGTDTIDVENAAGATFGGYLSGPGILNKTGPGTLTIANANYLGGAVVAAGIPQIGGGSFSGTIDTIVNNGSLVLTGGTARLISGTGSLTVTTGRVSVVMGTYAGPTFIENGGAFYGGDLSAATGTVTVDQGGLIGGKYGGSITVNANGVVEGGGAVVRAISANSNVTFNAGATFYVNFAPTSLGSAHVGSIYLTNPNPANNIFNLNVGSGAWNVPIITTQANALAPGARYAFTIVTVPTGGAIELNGSPVGANFIFPSNSYVSSSFLFYNSSILYNATDYSLFTDSTGTRLELAFTVVPEPQQVLLIAVIGLLPIVSVARRLRRSLPAAATW